MMIKFIEDCFCPSLSLEKFNKFYSHLLSHKFTIQKLLNNNKQQLNKILTPKISNLELYKHITYPNNLKFIFISYFAHI